jgi:hypothetical protein
MAPPSQGSGPEGLRVVVDPVQFPGKGLQRVATPGVRVLAPGVGPSAAVVRESGSRSAPLRSGCCFGPGPAGRVSLGPDQAIRRASGVGARFEQAACRCCWVDRGCGEGILVAGWVPVIDGAEFTAPAVIGADGCARSFTHPRGSQSGWPGRLLPPPARAR